MSGMEHKVGIEVGDTSSRIAYFEDEDIQIFQSLYSEQPQRALPPQLAFERQSRLSNATLSYLKSRMLSIRPDFCSLSNEELSSRKGGGKQIVIALPEADYRRMTRTDKLASKQAFSHELCIDSQNLRLVSHPAAAATQWIQQRHQRAALCHGSLLIFDVGRGALRTHLCHITDSEKVEVLYSAETEAAGRLFDRECIRLAYAQKHGDESIDEASQEFEDLLRYFEAAKHSNPSKSAKRLDLYAKAPDLMKDYNLYCFGGGYAMKCHQVAATFAPVGQVIGSEVKRIQDWLAVNDQSFDFLIFIGGFSAFPLVQKALFAALDVREGDERFDLAFSQGFGLDAIAQGACLIANDVLDPVERIPFTIGIVAETLSASAEIEEQFIPVISAGSPLEDLFEVQFVEGFRVQSFQNELFTLTLGLKAQNKIHCQPISLALDPLVLPNFLAECWQIGTYIDATNTLTLVIKAESSSQQTQCQLGTLSDFFDF